MRTEIDITKAVIVLLTISIILFFGMVIYDTYQEKKAAEKSEKQFELINKQIDKLV